MEQPKQIFLYEVVDDMVGANETVYYELAVDGFLQSLLEESELSMDIHPYQGNPDLFISPSPKPGRLEEFRWNSSLDVGFEAVTISSKQRDLWNSTDAQFILAIHGKDELSTFSFVLYISDHYSRMLATFSVESGFMVAGDVISYICNLDEGDRNYTIQATYPQGSGILVLKKCKRKDDFLTDLAQQLISATQDDFYKCAVSQKDVQAVKKAFKGDRVELDQLVASQNSIKFFYNDTECYLDEADTLFSGEIVSKCVYIAAVIATADAESKYVLSMRSQDEHIRLHEEQSIKSALMMHQKDYYKFTLEAGDDYVEVQFQLTVLSGDVFMFGSRTNQWPSETDHDQQAILDLSVMIYRADKNHALPGDYYLTVYADSLSVYTINTFVLRERAGLDDIQTNYVQLYESVPQLQTFSSRNEVG